MQRRWGLLGENAYVRESADHYSHVKNPYVKHMSKIYFSACTIDARTCVHWKPYDTIDDSLCTDACDQLKCDEYVPDASHLWIPVRLRFKYVVNLTMRNMSVNICIPRRHSVKGWISSIHAKFVKDCSTNWSHARRGRDCWTIYKAAHDHKLFFQISSCHGVHTWNMHIL